MFLFFLLVPVWITTASHLHSSHSASFFPTPTLCISSFTLAINFLCDFPRFLFLAAPYSTYHVQNIHYTTIILHMLKSFQSIFSSKLLNTTRPSDVSSLILSNSSFLFAFGAILLSQITLPSACTFFFTSPVCRCFEWLMSGT